MNINMFGKFKLIYFEPEYILTDSLVPSSPTHFFVLQGMKTGVQVWERSHLPELSEWLEVVGLITELRVHQISSGKVHLEENF